MKRFTVYGIIILIIFVFFCYGIELKNKKLLTIKSAESSSIRLFYEQIEFTNGNVASLLEQKTSKDAIQAAGVYLERSYHQCFVQMNSLGLNKSENSREIEYIWSQYWDLVIKEEISNADLIQMERLEGQILEIKNKIQAEENALQNKINNYWWN